MSNSNKHAPQPWIVFQEKGCHELAILSTEEADLIGDEWCGGGYVAKCMRHSVREDKHDFALHANARLISAAPDLLDALQTVVECGYIEDGYQPTIDLVMNAINKATGEKANA